MKYEHEVVSRIKKKKTKQKSRLYFRAQKFHGHISKTVFRNTSYVITNKLFFFSFAVIVIAIHSNNSVLFSIFIIFRHTKNNFVFD